MFYLQAHNHMQDFLKHLDVERNVALNTYKSYRYDLNQFFRFWLEANNNTAHAKELTIQEAVSKFFIHLHSLKVQKISIARKIACFQSFAKFLHSNNINLNLKLTSPRITKKLPTYMTSQEVVYLLDSVPDSAFLSQQPIRDRAILETLYSTGIRCSELTHIQLMDINFDQKTILITGKGNKQRIVLFGNKAKDILLKYLQTERAKHDPKNQQSYLFITPSGNRLQDRALQHIVQDLNPFLPFQKKITPHKLRHSFATHLLNAGMNLRALQELLGHSSLATTERYTHITTQDLKELYQNINPLQFLKKGV